jgi:hypothetical protein
MFTLHHMITNDNNGKIAPYANCEPLVRIAQTRDVRGTSEAYAKGYAHSTLSQTKAQGNVVEE